MIAQGDIYWCESPDDKRRPVLVITRSEAAAVLGTVVVAPISRTVRKIPTEIALGTDEGLPEECAASFDNLRPARVSMLTERAGALGPLRHHEICRSLAALADC